MKSVLKIASYCLLGFLGLVLLAMVGFDVLVVPLTLLLGWIPSARRILHGFDPGVGRIFWLLVALVILVAGCHSYFRWLYSASLKSVEGNARRQWPWKWTLCGFGVITCSLLAMGSLILVTHQFYWLEQSRDPMTVAISKRRLHIDHSVADDITNAAKKAGWETAATQAAFSQLRCLDGAPAWEYERAVWLENEPGKLRAIILIPCKPLIAELAHLEVIEAGSFSESWPLESLPEVLAKYGVNAPSKSTEPAAAHSK